MNLIEELQWRGLIKDIMPGTSELLENEQVKAYIGFDPTADSLHIGSLVPIILLMHTKRAGHIPYALIGGATGMVGDPSGKSEERNLLDLETLRRNENGVRDQLSKFIQFGDGPTDAKLLNNFSWFESFGFLNFIRDIGKHITVNYMMAKDSVKNRLENGMSFTEFSYQLIQGFDFLYLYEKHGVKLQIGGSDQWGNMLTGSELIRRKAQGDSFAFTAPLVKKADGGKFGKSESGNIWLDSKRTSPYKFYQFWLNSSDEDAKNYIKIFTFLSKEEIEDLIATHDEAPHQRALQSRLAEILTTFVHSEKDLAFAKKASQLLFGKSTTDDLLSLNEHELLDIFDGVPQHKAQLEKVKANYPIVDFLAETGIFSSKGEARKMVQGGGVSINKSKVNSMDFNIELPTLLNDKYILVQKGKKNYFLVSVN